MPLTLDRLRDNLKLESANTNVKNKLKEMS